MMGVPPPGRVRARRAPGARALGVLLAVVGLALFVGLVGADSVVVALGRLPPHRAIGLVVLGLVPVLVWGCSLWLVLGAVDVGVSLRNALSLYLASVFLNGVTPFGQAGGDPPTGLLVSHVVGTRFESGLAAITSVNLINRVCAVALGLAGGAWLLARAAIPGGLGSALGTAAGIVLVAVAAAALAWVHRDALIRVGGTALAAVAVPVAQRLPGVRAPSRASVVDRVRGFVATVERLSEQPDRVLAAFVLGVAGQLVVVGVFWAALGGVGADVPFEVVLVAVPVAKLSGLSPLPGGSVGAEVLLGALVSVVAGVPLSVATAAALLYRAAAFWVPAVLGGVATVGLLVRPGG